MTSRGNSRPLTNWPPSPCVATAKQSPPFLCAFPSCPSSVRPAPPDRLLVLLSPAAHAALNWHNFAVRHTCPACLCALHMFAGPPGNPKDATTRHPTGWQQVRLDTCTSDASACRAQWTRLLSSGDPYEADILQPLCRHPFRRIGARATGSCAGNLSRAASSVARARSVSE